MYNLYIVALFFKCRDSFAALFVKNWLSRRLNRSSYMYLDAVYYVKYTYSNHLLVKRDFVLLTGVNFLRGSDITTLVLMES